MLVEQRLQRLQLMCGIALGTLSSITAAALGGEQHLCDHVIVSALSWPTLSAAMGDEGHIDRDGLHNVVLLGTVARYEGIADPEELRAVLRSCRRAGNDVSGSPLHHPGADAPDGDVDSPAPLESTAHCTLHVTSSMKDSWAEAQLKLQLDDLQQQLKKERAAREKYARQLEKLAAEWMEQVSCLKEYIFPLKARLPQTATGTLQLPMQARTSSCGDDGSCLDNTVMALMQQLKEDLAFRGPLFEDDAEFIREVAGGDALAPDMQAQVELDRLRLKYEAWNKQFKSRLREAQDALKRGSRSGVPTASAQADSSSRSPVRITGSNRPVAVNVSKMPNLYAANLLC